MAYKSILEEAGRIFRKEPKLIGLPSRGLGVFVGDTHGDLDASETVLRNYLKKGSTVIFLGDYVDRGEQSRENIDLLLRAKISHPESLVLLMGNHEGYKFQEFSPCNFWMRFSEKEFEEYKNLLAQMPLAATSEKGILAIHGVPPDVENVEKINQIRPGSDKWFDMVWGDFSNSNDDRRGTTYSGRPEFGRKYFDRVMKKLGKNVLIRSHQPDAAGTMYDNRCLTLFTSNEYFPRRTVAIADLGKEIRTADDLKIIEI